MGDFGSTLEKNVAELTVMDVYDIAAVVGQEFERIIDQYGCEALSRLMPKIVRVLEILEVLVSRNNISPETEELRLELDRLRVERMDRLEKEKKQKKELEQVEDVWRGEAQDLLSQISQLQAENHTLLTSLSIQDTPTLGEELRSQEGVSEREKQVMRKLKGIVDKQRDEIRAKDRELTLRNEEVEALQQQQSRLMRINQDLRRRVGMVEAQGKALIQQRAGLEAGLQARQQELGELQNEVCRLREQLQEESRPSWEESPLTPPPEESEEYPVEDSEALELKDPNRPRFTLQELRDVLHERNELKAQVFMLQEEVAYYRSEELEEEMATPSSVPAPLPQPNVQPDSGIKRLFSFFSRDKKSGAQKNARFAESVGIWARQNDIYTEQAQEALQYL